MGVYVISLSLHDFPEYMTITVFLYICSEVPVISLNISEERLAFKTFSVDQGRNIPNTVSTAQKTPPMPTLTEKEVNTHTSSTKHKMVVPVYCHLVKVNCI